MRINYFSTIPTKTRSLFAIVLLGLGLIFAGLTLQAHAQNNAGVNASPNVFIQTVVDNALRAVKGDAAAKAGDLHRINALVDQYVLPYVNLEKTTRLAAAQNWRKATAQQQKELVAAFKGTLIRTYSGALSNVNNILKLNVLPFRGDPNADDVVVRSTFSQTNGPSANVDYRLEKTPNGWKIYDVNVEGIWLIQNYRNQFSQEVAQNGIEGLIAALNQKNRER